MPVICGSNPTKSVRLFFFSIGSKPAIVNSFFPFFVCYAE